MKTRVVDSIFLTAALVLTLGPVILFIGRCLPAFFVDSIDLGDSALFQIGMLDAATFDRVLGPYSRFGFNHPGPLPFYMLLPFFLAGGQTTGSLAVAAMICNFLWLVLMMWTIRKTWGTEAALFANLPLALIVLWMGPTQFFSIWNPSLGLLPLAASVVFLAASLSGKPLFLFGYVISASIAGQCHVYYLVYAVIFAAIGSFVILRRATLTRISHRLSAATGDAPRPAVFSRLEMLTSEPKAERRKRRSRASERRSSTTPRPSGRKPHWAWPLTALATQVGEKCGLATVINFVRVNRRWLFLGLAMTCLLWSPVLIEEITGSPGNMSLLIHHLDEPGGLNPRTGFFSALASIGELFTPLGTGKPDSIVDLLIAFFLLITIILGLVVSWMQDQKLPPMLVFSFACFAVTWVTQSQPGGASSPHLLWGGVITGFITSLSLLEIFLPKLMAWRPWSGLVTLTIVLILSCFSWGRFFSFPPLADLMNARHSGSPQGKVIDESLRYVQNQGERSAWIHLLGPDAWVLGAGIALEMKKNGIEPHVATRFKHMFGQALTGSANSDNGVLVVGPQPRIDALVTQNRFTVVATTKSLAVASPQRIFPPFSIDLSSDNALGLLRNGWAPRGKNGRWAIGKSSSLFIPDRESPVRVQISVMPFYLPDEDQGIRILDMTDSLLAYHQLRKGWQTISVLLPPSPSGTILRLVPDNTRSPFELGRGKDKRQFSFNARRLEVSLVN